MKGSASMDGGWGGTISVEENFLKENKGLSFCEIIVLEQRRDLGYFVIFADRIYKYCSLDFNPYPSDLK